MSKKSMSKKSRSKKGGKSKKLRKTRRLKRRSSKKRGGVAPRQPVTDAPVTDTLLNELSDASRAGANALIVQGAFDGFISNEKTLKDIYLEDGFDRVTTYILDKFRGLLSNPGTMQMIRIRTEELNMQHQDDSEGDEDDEIKNWRDIYNNLRHIGERDLAERYDDFIQELFSLVFPAAEPHEDY